MIRINLYREIENLFCPLTGAQLLDMNGYSPAPTLKFIYIPEAEAFEYTSKSFKNDFPGEFDEKGQTINAYRFYKKLKKNKEWGDEKLLITLGEITSIVVCLDLGCLPTSQGNPKIMDISN